MKNLPLQFKPQCLYNPDKLETVMEDCQCLGHSAKGYFMPCCFIDAHYWTVPEYQEHEKLNKLWDESLKLSNNKHVLDITTSDIWIDFYTMLQDDSQEKPKLCLHKCQTPVKRKKEYKSFSPRTRPPIDVIIS
jgi:hypothetical protein